MQCHLYPRPSWHHHLAALYFSMTKIYLYELFPEHLRAYTLGLLMLFFQNFITGEDCLRLPGWALNAVSCILFRGRLRENWPSQRRRRGKDRWRFQWGGKKPRNSGSPQQLKDARNSPPESLLGKRGSANVRPGILISDFKPSEPWVNTFRFSQPLSLW